VSSLFLDQVFTLFCYEVLSRWTHQVISHTWTVEDGWSVVSSFCSRGTPPREVPPVLGPYSASSALVVPLQERSQHLLLSWYPSKMLYHSCCCTRNLSDGQFPKLNPFMVGN
jgi:hypothetical protein